MMWRIEESGREYARFSGDLINLVFWVGGVNSGLGFRGWIRCGLFAYGSEVIKADFGLCETKLVSRIQVV